MTLAALVAASLLVIALPHVLQLRRADPAAACALWGAGLGVRAMLVVGTVVGRCSCCTRPSVQRHRAMAVRAEHRVAGHLAAVVGGLALSLSLLYALARVAQAAVAVRRLVRHPLGSVPRAA